MQKIFFCGFSNFFHIDFYSPNESTEEMVRCSALLSGYLFSILWWISCMCNCVFFLIQSIVNSYIRSSGTEEKKTNNLICYEKWSEMTKNIKKKKKSDKFLIIKWTFLLSFAFDILFSYTAIAIHLNLNSSVFFLLSLNQQSA